MEGTPLLGWIQGLLSSIWYELLALMTWNRFIILIGPTVWSRLMKPRVYVELPSKPDTSMRCFVFLSRDIPAVSRIYKRTMFNEDPRLTSACLSLTYRVTAYHVQWPVMVAISVLPVVLVEDNRAIFELLTSDEAWASWWVIQLNHGFGDGQTLLWIKIPLVIETPKFEQILYLLRHFIYI